VISIIFNTASIHEMSVATTVRVLSFILFYTLLFNIRKTESSKIWLPMPARAIWKRILKKQDGKLRTGLNWLTFFSKVIDEEYSFLNTAPCCLVTIFRKRFFPPYLGFSNKMLG